MNPDAPLVLCLHAAADSAHHDTLLRHLRPAINRGSLRLAAAREHLDGAALVLLFLSADLYSDGRYAALAPRLATLPDGRLVPVLLRDVAYEHGASAFPKLQCLPRDGLPVTAHPDEDTAFTALAREIVELLLQLDPLPPRPPSCPAPPARQHAGAAYDPRWCVPRPKEEREARSRLESPGLPLVIQGPHLFGKTWLLEHLLAPLRGAGQHRLVDLNLAGLSEADRAGDLALRRALAERVLTGINAPRTWVDEHLPAHGGADPSTGFERLLKRALLEDPRELLLAIDRADDIPAGAVRTGFYKQLRAFADQGPREPWSRLRLLLCISTTPEELQPDAKTSPFNVAPPILLGELSAEQVAVLLVRYGLRWSDEQRDQALALVGGHPYLLRLLMDQAAQGAPLHELLQDESDLFEDHLYKLDLLLDQSPDLREALRRLAQDPQAVLGQRTFHRLHRMGLVDWVKGTQKRRTRLRGALYDRLIK